MIVVRVYSNQVLLRLGGVIGLPELVKISLKVPVGVGSLVLVDALRGLASHDLSLISSALILEGKHFGGHSGGNDLFLVVISVLVVNDGQVRARPHTLQSIL